MQNVLIMGRISTMSNKNDSKFKQETPTKTVYLTVGEVNQQKLIDFGLTLYTSKEGEDFFAVKAAKTISCYTSTATEEAPAKLDMSTATGVSVKTADDVEIKMNIVSGENMGNQFFRLQAIKLKSSEDLEEIRATNPFADEDDF